MFDPTKISLTLALTLVPTLAIGALPWRSTAAHVPMVRARPEPVLAATSGPNVAASFQLVYFAVLEGLYADGVSNDVVDALTARGENGSPELFVWSCPLCMPAYNAFKAYRGRPKLENYKVDIDTFGCGLSPTQRSIALSASRSERFETLGKLIEGWVERRLELLRLSPEEREHWRQSFEELRKQGMSMAQGDFLDEFKRCTVCDAANAACK
jgi:hypothetical protein